MKPYKVYIFNETSLLCNIDFKTVYYVLFSKKVKKKRFDYLLLLSYI